MHSDDYRPRTRTAASRLSDLSDIARLGIELLIALRQYNPRLLASCPDVNGGPQPGRIIECATEDRPDHCLHQCSWSRLSTNTCCAIGANATPLNAPTISYALNDPWRLSREPNSLVKYQDADGEGAARDMLAVRAVAGVDQDRRAGDFVADTSTQTAAGQGQVHRAVSPPLSALSRMQTPFHRSYHDQRQGVVIVRRGAAIICGSTSLSPRIYRGP